MSIYKQISKVVFDFAARLTYYVKFSVNFLLMVSHKVVF
jgi:hypothetical protein